MKAPTGSRTLSHVVAPKIWLKRCISPLRCRARRRQRGGPHRCLLVCSPHMEAAGGTVQGNPPCPPWASPPRRYSPAPAANPVKGSMWFTQEGNKHMYTGHPLPDGYLQNTCKFAGKSALVRRPSPRRLPGFTHSYGADLFTWWVPPTPGKTNMRTFITKVIAHESVTLQQL